MAGFGGAVKLTGESEYRRALKQITQNLKTMSSEMKRVSTQYASSDRSIQTLTAKQKSLESILSKQKATLQQVSNAYNSFKQKVESQTQAHQKLEKEYQDAVQELEKIKQTSGETSQEYQKQAQKVAELAQAVSKSTDAENQNAIALGKLETQLNNAQAEVNKTTNELKDNASAMQKVSQEAKQSESAYSQLTSKIDSQKSKLEQLKREYVSTVLEQGKNSKSARELKSQIDQLNSELQQNVSKLNSAEAELKDYDSALEGARQAGDKASDGFTVMKGALASLVADGIRRAVSAMKELAKEVVVVGATFDSSMAEVEAISGATADQMEQLTAKAKEMGETTKFTASESGEALKYMAMAGWKTEDMLSGLEGIMNLASASGEDLATTSDIVTDALTAMGYSAGDATQLADVMASASSNANTNVSLMGETFKYVAPLIGAMGYNMEDTAVAIGLMANAGVKGTQAGTALRSTISRLASPTADVEKAMKDLGISLQDENGEMKSLDKVMRELRKSFSGLDEVQKAQYATSIAGKNALSGFLAIVNSSDEDFNKLTLAVNNSAGASERMASTMLDNVGGQFTILKSQIEGIYLTVYQKLEPTLRKAMTQISKSLKEVNWESFGRTAGEALTKLVNGFTWVLNNGKTVTSIVSGLVGAFVASKVTGFALQITQLVSGLMTAYTATGSLTGAMATLNLTMLANPITAVVAGFVGLGVAMYALNKEAKQVDVEMEALSDAIAEQSTKVESAKESWDSLNEARQESLNKGMTELSHYQSLYDELTGLVDANGKVKEGYEGRAQFITSTLADALGLEISYVDGVIEGYDELASSIDTVMEKKRAQIILDSQESAYADAIANQAQKVRELNDASELLNQTKEKRDEVEKEYQDLVKQSNDALVAGNEEAGRSYAELAGARKADLDQLNEEVSQAQSDYDTLEGIVADYVDAVATYEANQALFMEGKYDEMATTVWQFADDVEQAGDEQKKSLEQQKQDTETHLSQVEKRYKETGSEIYKSQIDADKKQLQEIDKNLKQYESTTNTGLTSVEKEWARGLGQQLSTITGKKVEFKSAGDNQMQMYVNGIKTGEPKTKTEMQSIASSSLATLRGYNSDYNTIGYNYSVGVGSGVSSGSGSVMSRIRSMANDMVATLKANLKVKSPSRVTMEIGKYFAQGFGKGIVDEEKSVKKQVAQFGTSTVSSLNEALKVINRVNKENAKKSSAELSKIYVSQAKTRVNELKKANKLTETEEVNFWQTIVNHTKKGTSAYNSAVSNLASAKNNLKNDISKATKTFITDVNKANTDLQKKIKELKNTYKEAVAKRQEEVMNSFGLFDAVTLNEKVGENELLNNLNAQVKTLKKYNSVMASLRKKISNQDLIDELESMGVENLSTLQSIASMNKSELKEYQTLYEQKKKLSNKIAKAENADLLAQTNAQIESLKKSTDKQIATIKKTYLKNLKKLGVEGNKESVNVGKQITSGISAGITAGFKSVNKTTKNQINSMLKEIKKQLGIKSPSRVFRDEVGDNLALGIGQGFEETMQLVKQQMQDAIPTSFDTGTAITGARYESSSNNMSMDSMVSAFKEALGQVKIVIDDEVAGEFINKTVSNLIYT